MHMKRNAEGSTLLIIGGAGGVGSIAIQLAKLAKATVIATASRPETNEWCLSLGADHIIDHHQPLLAQLQEKGIGEVDYILCLNDTDGHFKGMAEAIKPQGTICTIVENQHHLDIQLLKNKSLCICMGIHVHTADVQNLGYDEAARAFKRSEYII